MFFIQYVEDEFIRETVSKKLDKPLFNPSDKVWRYSTKTNTTTSPFHICDSLRYTNYGENEMVEKVDIKPMIMMALSTALSI